MNAWAFEMLVATSLLMALVLAIRSPVARAFGPRAAYALWALPALRVIMPSLPGWRLFYVPVLHLSGGPLVAGLVDPVSAARIAAEDAAPLAPVAPVAPFPQIGGPVQPEALHWQAVLLAVWLGGALLWFGWQMLRYRLFLAQALRSAALLTSECGVDVFVTPQVDGPVAAGLTTRRIFLPADFMARYTPAERRLALLHEGAHHDRHDIAANFVALALLALHWWNPLAHRAYRAFRADQELACDATVLADVAGGDRHAYGSAVLKSASARMPGVACALSHKDEIKRRLRTMAAPRIGARRAWAGVAVAIAAIGAGLVVTASGQATPVDPGTFLSPADLAQIRADAAEARRDGLRAAEEGRRVAEEGRREAMRQRAAAFREGALAAREAQVDALRSREDELARARDALAASQDRLADAHEGETARSVAAWSGSAGDRQVAALRQKMAARCADREKPVSPDLDWSRLALCGDTGASIAARINAQVHRHLAAEGIG